MKRVCPCYEEKGGDLVEPVAKVLKVPEEEIKSKARKREIATARRIFMIIVFNSFANEFDLKTEDIADIVNKNRTLYFHNRKTHEDHYETDKNYKVKFDLINKSFVKMIETNNVC